jgi:hypothetical protein
MTETVRTIVGAVSMATHRLSFSSELLEKGDAKELRRLDLAVNDAMEHLDHWNDPDWLAVSHDEYGKE